MDWLHENLLTPMLALLAAWHWYDKRMRDRRLSELEARLQIQESSSAGHLTAGAVLETRLESIEQIMEIRLGHIQATLSRMEEQ